LTRHHGSHAAKEFDTWQRQLFGRRHMKSQTLRREHAMIEDFLAVWSD
jgi:hypothetical protein